MAERTFGKYELIRKIGQGGMAEIFLARQSGIEGFEKQYVLKMLLPHLMELRESREFVQMFLDEARLAARLSHPHVVQIYELGQAEGRYYLAMEYVNGADLGQVLARVRELKQLMPIAHAVRIVAIVCEALGYAHGLVAETGLPLGIIHRDVCPQNVLISFEGGVKLTDFGVAKAASHVSKTNVGALKGRIDYMSPEQASGEPLDARSDIFSVGALLYQLTTGELPFSGSSDFKVIEAIIGEMPRPPSGVNEDFPLGLSPIIGRAMAKSPSDRFASALEMQLELERFLVEEKLVSNAALIGQYLRPLLATAAPAVDAEQLPARPEPTVKVFVPVPGPYDAPAAAANAVPSGAPAAVAAAPIGVAAAEIAPPPELTTEDHGPTAEQTAQIAALGDMPTLMAARTAPAPTPAPASEIPSEVFQAPSEIRALAPGHAPAALEVTVPVAQAAAAVPPNPAIEATDRDRLAIDGADTAAGVEPVWATTPAEITASEKLNRPFSAPEPRSIVLAASEPTVRWMPPADPTPAAPTALAEPPPPAAPAAPIPLTPATAVRPAGAPISAALRNDPVREHIADKPAPGHLSISLGEESSRQPRPAAAVPPAVGSRPATAPAPAARSEHEALAPSTPRSSGSRLVLAAAIGAGVLAGVGIIAMLVGRDRAPSAAAEPDASVLVTPIAVAVPLPPATRPATKPDASIAPAVIDAASAPAIVEPRPTREYVAASPQPGQTRRTNSQKAQEICQQGNRLILQGKFEEAATQFKQALALDPNSADAKRGLGIANDRLDRDPKRLFDQGNRAILKGRYDDAIRHFELALQADANYAEAHRGLGLAYSKLGKDRLAARHYLAYVTMRPRAADAERVREMIKQLDGKKP